MQPAVTRRFLFLVFLVSGCATLPDLVLLLPDPETTKTKKLLEPASKAGGVPDGAGSVSYPKLLNREEIFGLLRRYYPESKRRAGRGGTVVLTLHVGVDGRVSAADVATSAGTAFDRAAVEVAKLMRFEPARTRNGPVAVKLPQTVVFQIER